MRNKWITQFYLQYTQPLTTAIPLLLRPEVDTNRTCHTIFTVSNFISCSFHPHQPYLPLLPSHMVWRQFVFMVVLPSVLAIPLWISAMSTSQKVTTFWLVLIALIH